MADDLWTMFLLKTFRLSAAVDKDHCQHSEYKNTFVTIDKPVLEGTLRKSGVVKLLLENP